ncbi:MAG: rubrerythrin family protein [Syntrophobacterales bacterium]|nr:rubrerythrin family protein [Syntrophobacterales bacterium]
MKNSSKGTKTEKNLMVAFASESMAVIRYALFAEVAGREGYEKAASAFRETAKDEKTHARIFMRLFEGGMTEITAGFPAGPAGDTKKNLEAAIDGEGKSWRVRYAEFAKTAREEGLEDIAVIFEKIAADERRHEENFHRIREGLE